LCKKGRRTNDEKWSWQRKKKTVRDDGLDEKKKKRKK
jgi:hypothetical protein